jgi:hypothetical protein
MNKGGFMNKKTLERKLLRLLKKPKSRRGYKLKRELRRLLKYRGG